MAKKNEGRSTRRVKRDSMKTAHITEEFQSYMVKNPRTFKNSHTEYLKKRKALFLNGQQQNIEVISVMNQQFAYIEEREVFFFTADVQYKITDNGEEE